MTDKWRRRQVLAGMGAALAASAGHATAEEVTSGTQWHTGADVVVVGAGAAGACAAIEAQQAGASVLLLEALSRAGGASGLSGGTVYAGGGTALQRALGVEDSVQAMFDYLARCGGPNPPRDKIRMYCEGSPAHYDWLVAQGVPYHDRAHPGYGQPGVDASLFYSGDELSQRARQLAAPAPRGHIPAAPANGGGRLLMEKLLGRARTLGAQLITDASAERLVIERDGRVAGVVVATGGGRMRIRARRALVLTCGGFIQRRDMVRRYAPRLHECATPWGGAGELGQGINMGVAAGAAALRMDEGCALTYLGHHRPALSGLLVNAAGLRFVAEDAWPGAIGHAITYEQHGRAWLLTDEGSALEAAQVDYPLVAESATIGGVADALGMPRGSLEQTVAYYNRYAGRGEDPVFGKAKPYLRPLQGPPYRAWAVSGERAFFPAFTLGGLETDGDGRVLGGFGEPIPGLFAAGRNAAGLATAPLLASGLSLGDATFFGRRAGRIAAGGR